jgi:hypothetical protein
MRKRQSIPKVVEKSRVVVDSRDGSKDKFIPTLIARKLYDEGRLAIDMTNSVYERVYCPTHDDTWKKYTL